MSDSERPISEKTKVSVALVLASLPVLWLFANDHAAIAALTKDRDDLRGDVKEIKAAVEDIRLQLARRQLVSPEPERRRSP